MKPSVVRNVHYVPRPEIYPVALPRCLGAIIAEVHDDEACTLTVFFPEALLRHETQRGSYRCTSGPVRVPHDENKGPGTWHWPERVE